MNTQLKRQHSEINRYSDEQEHQPYNNETKIRNSTNEFRPFSTKAVTSINELGEDSVANNETNQSKYLIDQRRKRNRLILLRFPSTNVVTTLLILNLTSMGLPSFFFFYRVSVNKDLRILLVDSS